MITVVTALYFNVFVLIVQLFLKVPLLKPLAPTQTEPPFFVTQLLTPAGAGRLDPILDACVAVYAGPKELDLAIGILEAIDMDSYRVEKKAATKLALADADAEIEPVPVEGGGHRGA